MNWEAIGAIAEGLGAIGVIVSLVYLAGQIRLNTMAIRGSSSFDAEAAYAGTNEHIVALSDKTKEILIRAYDPTEDLNNFDALEGITIGLHLRSVMQKCSGQYYQNKNGLLDDELWDARLRWASGWIKLPVVAQWWETEKGQGQFSPEFIRILESYTDPAEVIRTGVDR